MPIRRRSAAVRSHDAQAALLASINHLRRDFLGLLSLLKQDAAERLARDRRAQKGRATDGGSPGAVRKKTGPEKKAR